MPAATALHTIGFYCGRHGSGLLDEPQNSFSNVGFVLGALVAHWMWRKTSKQDHLLLVLTVMLALIGVGSFVFHSYPTAATLSIDLIPIQVYTLVVLFYLLTRLLGYSWVLAGVILLSFVLLRQGWILMAPPRLLGGGGTHLPAVLALLMLIVLLARRHHQVWKYLVAAVIAYVAALLVRSWDVRLCHSFPLGLHWLWHLGTALAGSLVLIGLIRSQPRPAAH